MFKLTAICVAALIALQAPSAYAWQAPVAATDAALASQIDTAIASHFKADQPGATVIVTKDGKTVLRKAYGLANVEQKLALQPDMTMRLGSITKQFTAVAILMLAEQGKLSLDDDIGRYFPDYPASGKKVTIAQLLNHTSGVASYTGMRGFGAEMHKDFTVTQMIDRFKDLPLDFAPGQDWIYSNSGYFLLGAIIEKVSGKPYADFVADHIFKPLAMENSAYEGHERGKAPKASGYSASEKGFVPTRVVSMTQPYAAGSLVSTVDDLARWDAAISSGKLLKAASWQRAFTGTILPNGKPTNYGLGWQVGTLQGEPTISHGGGIPGFSTYAIRVPAKNVFVAVLTNADSGLVSSEMVTSKAAAIAIGKPFPELKAIEVDAKVLSAYEGVYKIDDKTDRTFRLDGAKLTMVRTGRRPVEVVAYKPDGFFMPNTLVTLEFARDASGKVVDVTVNQNGSGQRNVKLVP
jgi:D-alanyl-D-alanine carboxypeptidase